MSQRFEGDFVGYKDLELFYQGWEVPNPKGTVVIIHGQAEHSECYNHLAEFLNKHSLNAYAYDFRGHGKSEGQRGYASDFTEYEKDTERFLQLIQSKHHNTGPFIVFAHSMGGLVALKTLIANGSKNITALCLSSPELGFAIDVPIIKEKGAEILANVFPRFTLSNEITFDMLTSVPEAIESMEKDSLRHDRISANVFIGMKQGFELVRSFKSNLKCPILMQLSGLDPICSTDDSLEFFNSLDHIENKKFIVYQKSLHEIVNDKEQDQVFADFLKFIQQFL